MQVFHSTPSPGYIAWQNVNIQYKGVTYVIPNGNTNKKFVMWLYSDPGSFYGSDTFPTLGPDDLLVFLNKNGVYSIVPKTQIVDGSLIVSDSITTDALAANSVTAEKIAAGSISADKIAANAIGAEAIIAGAIGADEIAAGVIATNHLAALAVTADKIAAGAISADKVAANAIGAEKIAAGAITAEKLSVGVAAGISGPIDADNRPVKAVNNQITMDSTGLKMRRAGETIDRMHLDARRLGFRDPTTNKPTAGIGYVRDLAQELDPTANPSDLIAHGLFIAQGEIRATQSVVSDSLTEGGTGFNQLADGSVALQKLSGILSVTIPDRLQREGVSVNSSMLTTNYSFEGNLDGWASAGGTNTVSTAYKVAGTYSVLVSAQGIYQGVPAAAGEIWRAQTYCRTSAGAGAVVGELSFHNSGGTKLSGVNITSTQTNSFEQILVYGTAPANTASARLSLKSGGGTTYHDYSYLQKSVVGTSYDVIASRTIAKNEAIEQYKAVIRFDNPQAKLLNIDLVINGTSAATANSSATTADFAISVDTRSYSGNLVIELKAKQAGGGYVALIYMYHYVNQRLPLRGASPRYSISGGVEATCGSGCEALCQTLCQATCQDTCQDTCQADCQSTCQSTCETTSQGGGCWVEGTPVTVYDSGAEAMREIPVEKLVPGMQMPWYNIAADTIELTECVSNPRTWTHTIYVAEVEGGHRLEMTGEQPMDVLREHDGEQAWLKTPARYIVPGDRLVRPFDGTMHEVLSLAKTLRAQTYVYNPRTASGRYIAAGFSDPEKVLT